MTVAVAVMVWVALFARLDETLSSIIYFVCLLELVRGYMILRYFKKIGLEIRRMELELYQPNQWYSDRR
jgi:hypothetical protein